MQQFEEKLYEMAGEELASKQVKRGVWAKAFAVAQGDEAKTKATYIELRVAQLRERFTGEDALIQKRLGALRTVPYRDDERVPNSRFDGHCDTLSYPVPASVVADALGITETEIIVAIRSGYVVGVRQNGDWFVELWPAA